MNKKIINKIIATKMKSFSSLYGYKKKDYILFKKSGDYFLTLFLYSTGFNNEKLIISGRVKPYFFDDILWDVMNMPENKFAPDSLRAVGAFAFEGIEVFFKEITLFDINEAEKSVIQLFEEGNLKFLKCLENLKKFNNSFDEFVSDVKDNTYDMVLGKMLSAIKKQKYAMAVEIAKNELNHGRYGKFGNDNKNVYNLIIDYCSQYIMII